MNHTDMTKPFSINLKLANWVPSEQKIQTITAARELWELVPEEEGDDHNLFKINALDVISQSFILITLTQFWDFIMIFQNHWNQYVSLSQLAQILAVMKWIKKGF